MFCTCTKNLSLVSGNRVGYYHYIFYICTPLKTVAENGIGNDINFKIMQNSKHTDSIVDMLFNKRMGKIVPVVFEDL